MNAKKRKDSCTFKRENSLLGDSLDKQERIYPLLPTFDGGDDLGFRCAPLAEAFARARM
jgi:hypothetical protein